jgi:hypothetical protein
MAAPLVLLAAVRHCLFTAMIVCLDLGRLIAFGLRSRRALAPENLFLRKELALFQERKIKPRRANDATRWMMANSEPNVPLARCSIERQAGYPHRLAPERIPLVLAMKIQAATLLPPRTSPNWLQYASSEVRTEPR